LGIGETMAIEMKEWSKETKQKILLSVGIIIAAAIFFAII
jgi:hypothetical protein